MTRSASHLVGAALCAAVVLLPACTPADEVGADATPSPVATSSPTTVAQPPSPSPSPSPAAVDEDAALAAAAQRRAERDDCLDDGSLDGADEVVAMADGVALVYVVCFYGAYQPNGELLLFDGDELLPLPVEQWNTGGVLELTEVTGFVVSEGELLRNEVKYRGLGDCGLLQRWSFDGERVTLVDAREQECRDDGEYVLPDEWPEVYP